MQSDIEEDRLVEHGAALHTVSVLARKLREAEAREGEMLHMVGVLARKLCEAEAREGEMLAALRAANRVFRMSVLDDGSTADVAARLVEDVVAKMEGRR